MTDDPLGDLMVRLRYPYLSDYASREEYDKVNSDAFPARREAEKLDDVSLLPWLGRPVRAAGTHDQFIDLSEMLRALTSNTGSAEAADLYVELTRRVSPEHDADRVLLLGAAKGRVAGCRDVMLGFYNSEESDLLVEVVHYLTAFGGPYDIRLIGELLDRDQPGGDADLQGVVALEMIGHPDGIPYLERVIEQHQGGEETSDKRMTQCAKRALRTIARLSGASRAHEAPAYPRAPRRRRAAPRDLAPLRMGWNCNWVPRAQSNTGCMTPEAGGRRRTAVP